MFHTVTGSCHTNALFICLWAFNRNKSHCQSVFWMKDDVMWWMVCACAELQDQAASEEDGLDGEAWARPLAQLWQNRPYNPEREKEYNREMGLRPPYCAVCTLFQAHQQVRRPGSEICVYLFPVAQVSDTSCAFLYDVLFVFSLKGARASRPWCSPGVRWGQSLWFQRDVSPPPPRTAQTSSRPQLTWRRTAAVCSSAAPCAVSVCTLVSTALTTITRLLFPSSTSCLWCLTGVIYLFIFIYRLYSILIKESCKKIIISFCKKKTEIWTVFHNDNNQKCFSKSAY